MSGNAHRFDRLRSASLQRLRTAHDGGSILRTLGAVAFAFVVSATAFAWLLGAQETPSRTATPALAVATAPLVDARFGMCTAGRGINCVIDGDTLRIGGTIIRVADIDTPEVRNYRCAAEKALGDRATQRLLALVNAGPFAIEGYERDEDRYGRKLRILARDGASLGMTLVSEGLARVWDGARHPWC